MELNYFKDVLFDLMNESDALPIAQIAVYDRENRFEVVCTDGSVIEVTCRARDERRPA